MSDYDHERDQFKVYKDIPHIDMYDEWEGGISNGLTLPCRSCGRVPKFDYYVDRRIWIRLTVPREWKLDVVCLPCLDEIAEKRGVDISRHLGFVQFTGKGKTVVLTPGATYHYDENRHD